MYVKDIVKAVINRASQPKDGVWQADGYSRYVNRQGGNAAVHLGFTAEQLQAERDDLNPEKERLNSGPEAFTYFVRSAGNGIHLLGGFDAFGDKAYFTVALEGRQTSRVVIADRLPDAENFFTGCFKAVSGEPGRPTVIYFHALLYRNNADVDLPVEAGIKLLAYPYEFEIRDKVGSKVAVGFKIERQANQLPVEREILPGNLLSVKDVDGTLAQADPSYTFLVGYVSEVGEEINPLTQQRYVRMAVAASGLMIEVVIGRQFLKEVPLPGHFIHAGVRLEAF